MDDKQIQTINDRDYALARRTRPRGLVGQIGMVLFEPGAFFRALSLAENSRQWVWAAVLILALVGISAVRQSALQSGGTPVASAPPITDIPGGGMPFGGPNMSGGPGTSGGGMSPAELTGGSSGSDVSSTWTTALLAAAGILLGWMILAVLLCEVSLFNGVAPRLGRNFQIAIWASVPVGLMAALQLLYYAAGGTVGAPGISGLLSEWHGYADLPHFLQSLLLSLTSHLTLFWLWSLALIFIGARMALRGRSWAVLLVVVAWVLVAVIAPVLTGDIAAPEDTGAVPDMAQPGMFEPPTGDAGDMLAPDGGRPQFAPEDGLPPPEESFEIAPAARRGAPDNASLDESQIEIAPEPQGMNEMTGG